jgi:hypothetical protein
LNYQDFYQILEAFNQEGGYYSLFSGRQAIPPNKLVRTHWNLERYQEQAVLDEQPAEFMRTYQILMDLVQVCVAENAAAVMLVI